MDHTARALGQSAKTACKRVMGITGPADNAMDVIHAGYDTETAERFADCVVKYMYLIEAKKR
jgi:hypothetical protein